MRKLRYILMIFLLVSIFQITFAQALKSKSPSIIKGEIGETFEINIIADNVSNLFGTSFNYNYNYNYIQLISVVNETTFLGDDVVFFPNNDSSNGVLSIGITRKAGQPNVSGSGNIVKATFEIINLPLQDTTIEFKITDITANDNLGNPIILYPNNSSTVININDSPEVSDIPDQTINEGESFTPINLDDYVSDSDNTDNEITWKYSENTDLKVKINSNRVATIETPDTNWYGIDTIMFVATDLDELSDSNSVVFTVKPVNDPPVVSDIPDQAINEGENFVKIYLDDYVSDSDNTDNEITWKYFENTDLKVKINPNRVATIEVPDTNWYGSDTIMFKATDLDGLSDSNSVVFTVNSINDTPVVRNIPDQTINEGESFTPMILDDYVSDPDNSYSEITWKYSENTDLKVKVNPNRVATIEVPDTNWYGSQTITFIATDPGELSDSATATFTVRPVNDPPEFSEMFENISFIQDSVFVFNIWEYVSDVETPDSLLIYTFMTDIDSIVIEYQDTTGECILSSLEKNYVGEGELTISVEDDSGATAVLKVPISILTDIKDLQNHDTPKEFKIAQNYPNPFNPTTVINYQLPKSSMVTLKVYNMIGEEVTTLVNREQPAGSYEVNFDASNLSSGVYYYRIIAGNFIETKKMLLLK